MKTNKKVIFFCFLFTLNVNSATVDDDIKVMEQLNVSGEVYPQSTVKLIPEQASILKDTAHVLKMIPGANVNKNGVLSNIAQYRGLFGGRVNVNADGVQVVESCSNSMDSAMSHVPASLVDAVVFQRGISPISQGIETLGGSIDVIGKSFVTKNEGASGDVNVGYASANKSRLGSFNMAQKYNQHGFRLGGSFERGENQSIPTGENVFTGFERNYYTAGYQFKNDKNTVSINTNYNDTGETGTPALPMDITYAKGGINGIEWSSELNDFWSLKTSFAYQATEHLMDNYRHRSQTPSTFRESFTEVERSAFSVKAHYKRLVDGFEFGLDFDTISNTAYINNPNNAQFQITNFDTSKQRNSLFFEYQRKVNESNQLLTGIRFSQTNADAAEVNSSVAMMNNNMGLLHRVLRDRFNAADRDKQDSPFDLMLNWQQKFNDSIDFIYGLAVKNRTPSHQERYLWLPLEATAGLADGRQYLGNLNLEPEQAVQFELGMNFIHDGFRMSPHVFYHRINDYIQGVPNTVMPAPEGTLRFDNVDAELYGFDIEWRYDLTESLSLSNVTSYVRGKRRDINDNLYRIAPINTWFNLAFQHKQWQIDTTWVAALKQDKVSVTNSEATTPGYGILHLTLTRSFNERNLIKFAFNNIFDKLYYDHTSGYNRNNLNSDVGFNPNNLQGFRLPGEGRGINISYFYSW